MKKNYICPNMEVVEIGFNHPLLAGSTTLSDPIPPGVSGAPEFVLEDDFLGNF